MKPRVNFTGRLGKDAEVFTYEGGKILVLSVASNDSYKDANGEKHQNTQWHTVKSFKKEFSEKFLDNLKKGTNIEVSGSLNYRSYSKEIHGEDVKFQETYIELSELDWL